MGWWSRTCLEFLTMFRMLTLQTFIISFTEFAMLTVVVKLTGLAELLLLAMLGLLMWS